MTGLFRTTSALLLALMLTLTSVSMALARGDMAVHGAMILCIGGVQVSVAIGPDGAPVLDEHICPDCVIGALALASDPDPSDQPVRFTLTDAPQAPAAHPSSPLQAPQARAPPGLV